MDEETVTLFLALVTVATQVTVVAVVAVMVAGRWWPAARRRRAAMIATVSPQALRLALLVAVAAGLSSLFLSAVLAFTPCTLCWYQRGAMYLVAAVLAVGGWWRPAAARRLALVVAGLGGLLATYHYLLERFPVLETGACTSTTSCAFVWMWRFHYISIPLMSLSAFALIVTLLVLAGPATAAPAGGPAAPERARAGHQLTGHGKGSA